MSSSHLSPRDKLKALEKQRSSLESQIKDLLEDIPAEFRDTTKKPKYVDAEGFPRSDIDIWSIAEVRKKVVMLQNDHIALMKQIEGLLLEAFKSNDNHNPQDEQANDDNKVEQKTQETAKAASNQIVDEKEKQDIIASMKAFISNASMETSETNERQSDDLQALQPFYVIDKIFDHSPSYTAGLKCGDLIVQFGSMTHSNQSAKLMQEIVKQSINKQIPVIVRRNPEGIVALTLTPQQWDGKGLLGCHLTPYP